MTLGRRPRVVGGIRADRRGTVELRWLKYAGLDSPETPEPQLPGERRIPLPRKKSGAEEPRPLRISDLSTAPQSGKEAKGALRTAKVEDAGVSPVP